MKPLDESLSSEVEDFLKKHATTAMLDSPEDIAAIDPISLVDNSKTTVVPAETQKEVSILILSASLNMLQ